MLAGNIPSFFILPLNNANELVVAVTTQTSVTKATGAEKHFEDRSLMAII